MTKEKHNNYSSDEIDEYIKKLDQRIVRLLWFMIGFCTAALIIMAILPIDGK